MRACLYPGDTDHNLREFFPDMGPGEMPLAGKTLCHHLVDLCGALKVSEVFVIDRFLNPKLADALGNGAYWSLRLHYINTERRSTLRELLRTRGEISPEASEEETIITWGLILPDIRSCGELFSDLEETDGDRNDPEDGVYLYRGGKYYRCRVPLMRCCTLKNYFDINFRLLQDPGIYSLPSYSLQNNYGIGRNVVMMTGCEAETPVLIQDNVLITREVSLKEGAIIGPCVVIDEKTSIRHSIVLSNTYIGRNMVIRNKIVNGHRVLDPESNSYVDLDDSFLTDDFTVKSNRHLLSQYQEQLFALCLAVFELPLYLAVMLLWKFLAYMPFPKFLRTIYPKLWLAAAGRLQLVRFGNGTDYVFRYSDLWWPAKKSKYEKNMGDVFYYHHRRFLRMAAVTLSSQIRRMLTLQDPENDPS